MKTFFLVALLLTAASAAPAPQHTVKSSAPTWHRIASTSHSTASAKHHGANPSTIDGRQIHRRP